MVDFSLKKGRKYEKHLPASTQSTSKAKLEKDGNPYSDMKVSAQYSQLPKINAKDRSKVNSSMQRRLSMHNANYVPPKLDYSMPLPSSMVIGSNGTAGVGQPQRKSEEVRTLKNSGQGADFEERNSASQQTGDHLAYMKPESLRAILADPNFNAKKFVHTALGDASAIEIDKFTSNLSELAIEVQEEARDNINKSYNEILNVNRDLEVASLELKQLRSSAKGLNELMQQFFTMAEKRLQAESQAEQAQSTTSPTGLLPPVRAGSIGGSKRDRSSVAILERIWDNQLSTLFKNVEGAQKYISTAPGRHILMESGDWIELNLATLKPLQSVHIFILNDMVLVAGRPREKQKELVVAQCAPLREVTVTPEGASQKRLCFIFGHSTRCIYECRDPQEGPRLLNVVRRAKDDFHDIFQAEEENARKIKESFSYLQSAQQTPGREGTKSPVKSARRSLGSVTPGRNGDAMDSYLFQKITMSMHSRSRSRDVTSVPQMLKFLDDGIEEIDIEIGRLKFGKAVEALNALEAQLNRLAGQEDDDDVMLHGLITIKINQRRDTVAAKLSHIISTTAEVAPLIAAVKNMIKLGLPEDGLDLFLQNRSSYIQDLILQIGSLDNTTNYLTQIAVIRFQSIKKTIINFREIFEENAERFSSILVNWCREEADQHFLLIEKQLPNDEPISPASIRSSRRQIDGLKSVGLDFVYKLDDFIQKNSHKIR